LHCQTSNDQRVRQELFFADITTDRVGTAALGCPTERSEAERRMLRGTFLLSRIFFLDYGQSAEEVGEGAFDKTFDPGSMPLNSCHRFPEETLILPLPSPRPAPPSPSQ
jgi:hypothetical protein